MVEEPIKFIIYNLNRKLIRLGVPETKFVEFVGIEYYPIYLFAVYPLWPYLRPIGAPHLVPNILVRKYHV